MTYIIFIFP